MSLSTSLPLTLFFFFSLSVVMDHNIMKAVGCACTINDVASWVRTTVSATTDPSGSNQRKRERERLYQMYQHYRNLLVLVLSLTMPIGMKY